MSKSAAISTAKQYSIKSVVPLLKLHMDLRQPVFLWGSMGIGKSETIASLVRPEKYDKDGNLTFKGDLLVDLRLSLYDPTDLKGIPFYDPKTNTCRWAQPSELPQIFQAEKYERIILFLDEMNGAPPSTLQAAYQLVLNYQLGEYVLPSNTVIIAAGNMDSDKGVTYKMPKPLCDRFAHYELKVDADGWLEWAESSGIAASVVSFISDNKSDLATYDPQSSDKTFATPRSWVKFAAAHDLALSRGMGHDTVIDLAGAWLGDGLAVKFRGHLAVVGRLPNVDDILDNKRPNLPSDLEMSAKFTLVIQLVYALNERLAKVKNEEFDLADLKVQVEHAIDYLDMSMDKEMVVMAVTRIVTAIRETISVRELANFPMIAKKYGQLLQDARSS